MFNRLNFNCGRFNTAPSGAKLEMEGAASLSLTGSAAGKLKISAPPTAVSLNIMVDAIQIAKIHANLSNAYLLLNAAGKQMVTLNAPVSAISVFSLGASGRPRRISFPSGGAGIELGTNSGITRHFQAHSGISFISFGVDAFALKRLFSASQIAKMSLDLPVKIPIRRMFAASPYASLVLSADGLGLRRFYSEPEAIEVILETSGLNLRRYFVVSPRIYLILDAVGLGMRRMFSVAPKIMLMLSGTGIGTRRLYSASDFSVVVLDTNGNPTLYVFSTIELPGLIVPPNADIIIDTGEMSVTMNGVDVTRYFGADSEFFKLCPGENLVVYTDGAAARNIDMKYIWKDLWI
jgi:hypothetical protein